MQGDSTNGNTNHGNTPVPEVTGESAREFRYPQTADPAASLTLTENLENLAPVSLLPLDSATVDPLVNDGGIASSPTFDRKVDLFNQVCGNEDEGVHDDVTLAKVRELHFDAMSTWSDDDDSLDLDWGGTSDRESVGTGTLNGYEGLYHSYPSPQPLSPQIYVEHTVARHPSPLMLNFTRSSLGNGPVGQSYGTVQAFQPGNEYADADAAANRTPINGTLQGPWDHIFHPTTPEDFVGDDFQGTSMEPPFP